MARRRPVASLFSSASTLAWTAGTLAGFLGRTVLFPAVPTTIGQPRVLDVMVDVVVIVTGTVFR